jgi:hypothetical protein
MAVILAEKYLNSSSKIMEATLAIRKQSRKVLMKSFKCISQVLVIRKMENFLKPPEPFSHPTEDSFETLETLNPNFRLFFFVWEPIETDGASFFVEGVFNDSLAEFFLTGGCEGVSESQNPFGSMLFSFFSNRDNFGSKGKSCVSLFVNKDIFLKNF